MVDPKNIPATMTPMQLEWWILFGIAVAGKNAEQTAKKLNAFLADVREIVSHWPILHFGPRQSLTEFSPFQLVRMTATARQLPSLLRKHKLGQYQRIEKAFRYAAANLDVEKLTLEDLESVPGMGPKTARMVMLYSNPSFDGVPLDTHILKYLKVKLPHLNVPKSTPPAGERYEFYEKMFQGFARPQGKTVRELDTQVWKAYQSGDLSQLPGVRREEI